MSKAAWSFRVTDRTITLKCPQCGRSFSRALITRQVGEQRYTTANAGECSLCRERKRESAKSAIKSLGEIT